MYNSTPQIYIYIYIYLFIVQTVYIDPMSVVVDMLVILCYHLQPKRRHTKFWG